MKQGMWLHQWISMALSLRNAVTISEKWVQSLGLSEIDANSILSSARLKCHQVKHA